VTTPPALRATSQRQAGDGLPYGKGRRTRRQVAQIENRVDGEKTLFTRFFLLSVNKKRIWRIAEKVIRLDRVLFDTVST
jgi:hypothetical protein